MDAAMSHPQFLGALRDAIAAMGSQKAAALAWGISQPYLSDILKGKRLPGPKLVGALGYQRQTIYVATTQRKEGTDDHP